MRYNHLIGNVDFSSAELQTYFFLFFLCSLKNFTKGNRFNARVVVKFIDILRYRYSTCTFVIIGYISHVCILKGRLFFRYKFINPFKEIVNCRSKTFQLKKCGLLVKNYSKCFKEKRNLLKRLDIVIRSRILKRKRTRFISSTVIFCGLSLSFLVCFIFCFFYRNNLEVLHYNTLTFAPENHFS